MLRRSLIALAILVMLPAAASAGSFTYYGPQLGFSQSPDQFVVGGFYRVHTERGIDENLNSPGAEYKPLAFETDCQSPDCGGKPGDPPNRFYTYGVVSRLAMLAAALEVEELVERSRMFEVKAANA